VSEYETVFTANSRALELGLVAELNKIKNANPGLNFEVGMGYANNLRIRVTFPN